MDYFRVAGTNLLGDKKTQFELIRVDLDRCCDEMLLSPDWETIIRLTDSLNACRDREILPEVFFCLRWKFKSRNNRIVMFALTLTEALVKNCDRHVHLQVNDEKFMAELSNLVRYYNNKPGRENIEICDQATDMVQTWGEAFLPQSRQFKNIVDTYHNLRKDGIKFHEQYDPKRAPIFTPTVSRDRTSSSSSRDVTEMFDATLTSTTASTYISSLSLSTNVINSIISNDDVDVALLSELISECRPLLLQVNTYIANNLTDADIGLLLTCVVDLNELVNDVDELGIDGFINNKKTTKTKKTTSNNIIMDNDSDDHVAVTLNPVVPVSHAPPASFDPFDIFNNNASSGQILSTSVTSTAPPAVTSVPFDPFNLTSTSNLPVVNNVQPTLDPFSILTSSTTTSTSRSDPFSQLLTSGVKEKKKADNPFDIFS